MSGKNRTVTVATVIVGVVTLVVLVLFSFILAFHLIRELLGMVLCSLPLFSIAAVS